MSDSSKSVQTRLEAYGMRVEEWSQSEKKWLDVDAVGADLGMSSFESRKLADLLADKGWVTIMRLGDGGPGLLKLRLVKDGFDEIAKMRWPRWRQWLDKNGTLAALWISLLALLVSIAVFVQRFFV